MGLFKIKGNDGTERRFSTLYLMRHEQKDLTPEQRDMMRVQRDREKQQKIMQQEREEQEASEEKKPLM